jgi:hypothetical protein
MDPLMTPELMAAPVAAHKATVGDGVRRLAAVLHRLRRSEDLKWSRRVAAVALAVLLGLGGGFLVLRLLPRGTPDYLHDDMDDVLGYTLLSDEFNRLPLEQRLALIKDLVQRLKTMSSSDSAAMAAFAATVRDEMRKQLEENIKRLAVDMMDTYAKQYESVDAGDRDKFLDDSIVGFTRLMEDISGEKSGLPEGDGERVAKVKEQAKKDEAAMKKDDHGLTAKRASAFFKFVHKDEDKVSDPVQRGRMTRFMRDMTRHLRNEDISTGRSMDGPG